MGDTSVTARLDAIDASVFALQSRMTNATAETATLVEEINTFYLMWAGTSLTPEWTKLQPAASPFLHCRQLP